MKNTIIYYTYFLIYYISTTYNILTSETKSEKQINKAIKFALMQHHKAKQRYDKKYPYFYHLKMVYNFVLKFDYLLSKEDKLKCFLGALFHDFLEDLTFTYNDLKELYGVEVADIVFACTELRGKNRDERHGPLYIKTLQKSRLGTFVKICDICANMTMGVQTGSSMLKKYRKEYQVKIKVLFIDEFKDIFDYIESTLLIDQK